VRPIRHRVSGAAVIAALALALPASGTAATIPVGTTADEFDNTGSGGGCSLREAVRAANTNAAFGGCSAGQIGAEDVIELPSGDYTLSRAGNREDSDATGDLDFDVGAGAGDAAIVGIGSSPPTIHSNDVGLGTSLRDRAIDVTGDGAFRLDGLTVIDGLAPGTTLGDPESRGGGIRWLSAGGGDLTIEDSAFDNDSALLAAAVEAGTTGAHFIDGTSFVDNLSNGKAQVHSLGQLTIDHSTIRGGIAGGISAEGTGADALRLANSTVTDNANSDTPIGALAVTGDALVVNSTITDNLGGFVGGLAVGGDLIVRFSTISDNLAPGLASGDDVGGIDTANAASVLLDGVILSGNRTSQGPSNCSPLTPAAEGTNPNLESANTCGLDPNAGSLIDTDPLLAPLAENGGPTPTRGLYPGSPAIGRALDCSAVPADQRGAPRATSGCDLGAFEGTVPLPAPPAAGPLPQPSASPAVKKKKCKKRHRRKRRCGKRR
jgi:CSLREA domain-containing protein